MKRDKLISFNISIFQGNQWPTWLSKLEGKSVEKSLMVQETLVPTADTERCNFFLELSIKYDRFIKRLF